VVLFGHCGEGPSYLEQPVLDLRATARRVVGVFELRNVPVLLHAF
jgi:hypothetical protein